MRLTDAQLAALDRLDRIGACWQAVSDLIDPSADLETRGRDHLAMLLDFLAEEYEAAREELRRACRLDRTD